MKYLLFLILLSLGLGGCAGMNTLQTPKALEQGKVNIGLGSGIGIPNEKDQKYESAFTQGMGWARVGIVENLDVGIKASFNKLLGADVKYQFVSTPVIVSALVGYGRGKQEIIGGATRTINAPYTSLMFGYKSMYLGLKMSDYYYLYENGNTRDKMDRIVPAITIGYFAVDYPTKLKPIVEVSSYFIPHMIAVGNVGFQYNF